MEMGKALKNILKEQGVKQTTLAKRLGIGLVTLNQRLGQQNMSIRIANEIAKAIGYKIVLMPDTERTPKGGYEV